MEILFIPYRFGTDILGGAEIYHVQIVKSLIQAGHNVEVLTTTARDFEPKTRFGLLWSEDYPAGDSIMDLGDGITCDVIRHHIKNPTLPSLWFSCYRLQKQFEQEQFRFNPENYLPVSSPVLFTGWHHSESHCDETWKWSSDRASIILPPKTEKLFITGRSPWKRTLTVKTKDGKVLFRKSVINDLYIEIEMPASGESGDVVWLEMPVRWGPAKDVRSLGIFINSCTAVLSNGEKIQADLRLSYHEMASRCALGETNGNVEDHDSWISHLCNSANERDKKFETMFDQARGPHSPKLNRWLQDHHERYDIIITANFPFAMPSHVLNSNPPLKRPIVLMPLMHLDDEYYYWQHYIDFMKKADAVLAISKYSLRVFESWGAKAHFAGVGIEPEMLKRAKDEEVAYVRERFGLKQDEKFVLLVCRKNHTKNYRIVIEAMEKVHLVTGTQLVFIGPDEDKFQINASFVIRDKGLSRIELRAAYAAASVFCLMSETESFGMVYLEAWSQETPVIGSAYCRPVIKLIEHGLDGFLVRSKEDLSNKLIQLLSDPSRAKEMGQSGRKKVESDWTNEAFKNRLSEIIRDIKQSRS